MSGGSRTGSYHHGDLRNALLAAAERLLRDDGPAGLSLRAVARAAGVSHTAPYRHFRDKAALLQALAERGFVRLAESVRAAAGAVPHGPEQQLVAAGIAYVKQALAHPETMRLMFSGVVDGQGTEADRPADSAAFTAVQQIVESGIAAGVFRQREPRELALVAWTGMHGLAMLLVAGQLDIARNDPAALETLVGTLVSNLLYGIAR